MFWRIVARDIQRFGHDQVRSLGAELFERLLAPACGPDLPTRLNTEFCDFESDARCRSDDDDAFHTDAVLVVYTLKVMILSGKCKSAFCRGRFVRL